MLKFSNLDLQKGNKVLLQNAALYVKPLQKVGITGKNGCGKSSLFDLIKASVTSEASDIEIPKATTVAFLAQEILAVQKSALDYVLDGDHKFRNLELQIAQATQSQNHLKLTQLHEKMLQIDGYSAKARAATLLSGLGFAADTINNPVKSFSGGWQMRINLAKTLMCPADLYLLDEPTNHLDLEAIVWLEKWLKHLKATVLIISHDRTFLDNITTHIAHFDNHCIELYTGNYSDFETQRAQKLILQQAAFEKQQRKRLHLQSFVDRFRYKASKAKQAQSRLKALEKMQQVSIAHADSSFDFSFNLPQKVPTPLIRLEAVSIGYDEPLVHDIHLTLNPKDRYAIIGANGAGKSTLIKTLAQTLDIHKGETFFHPDLKIGYFTQHQSDYLDLSASPLLHLLRLSPKLTEQQGRNFLGQFNFHGDMALESIEKFSGGEKARLALALLIFQNPNVLLLDEPTNHFDLDMRHALTLALQDFAGAIVLISHDRHLIQATIDELLLVQDHKLKPFKFSIDAYPDKILEETANKTKVSSTDTNKKSKKMLRQEAAQERLGTQSHQKDLKKIEKNIERCELMQKELHEAMQDPELYLAENKTQLNDLLQKEAELKKELLLLEEAWLKLQD